MEDLLEIICERELIEEDHNTRRITVRLGKPAKYQDSEFVCPFQIIGLEDSRIQYAHGEDCFQALHLALEGIRLQLNNSGKTLTWVGGETGDHGFPRYVPYSFGLDCSARLNDIIDQELGKIIKSKQKN